MLKEIILTMDVPNTLQSVMGQISREEVLKGMRNCVPEKLLWEVGDIINQMSTAHKMKVIEIVDSNCKRIKLEDAKLNTIAVKTKADIPYDSYEEITETGISMKAVTRDDAEVFKIRGTNVSWRELWKIQMGKYFKMEG